MTVLKYGETAGREVSKRVLEPVADEATLALLSSTQCAHLASIRVGAAWWYYDKDSAAAGSAGSVVLPADSVGRFLIDDPLGDVPAARTITSGDGLTGGGDLSANRTLAVGAGAGITVAADSVAVTFGAVGEMGAAANANAAGSTDKAARIDHTHAISAASGGAAGTMSAADFSKLALYPAISGLTTGQVPRATGAGTVAFGALDLANASAVTGVLPGANVAAAVAGVSAGAVTAADQTHINSTPTMQVTTGTLVNGTATINTVITVAANSEVIPYPDGAITGSTNFGSLQELRASRTAGAPSTGSITIQAIGSDGNIDADAAGAFHALIFTPHA